MTKIIDNQKEKFGHLLSAEIRDAREVAVASAYFNLEGYRQVKDALKGKPLKLLLGREPTEGLKFEEEMVSNLEKYEEELEREQSGMLSSELMQNEDDIGYFQLLKEAVDYFSGNKVEVKIVNGRFFHGKAYLGASPSFSDIRSGFASVGSSNFTGGGLAGNKELNMLTTDREVVEELSEWFMEQWNDGNSRNFKDKFLELLKNYVTTHSPYEVVAKALYEVYSPQLSQMGREDYLKSLYPHQVLSYTRARSILQDYGGVVIADSTGLGKTRVAISLAMDAVKYGKSPLLIAPKTALDTTWHDEMNKTHFHMDSINTELISSNPDTALRDYQDRDFIIIDEAHDFRTPSSNRYKALQEFMASGKREVVLLTATPVNNSLMDLYSLFSLFLPEDAISDMNVTLRGYFTEQQKKWLQGIEVDMDNILRRFVVRVSRDLAGYMSGGKINFPERKLDDDPGDRYDVPVDLERLSNLLNSLSFIYYGFAIEKLASDLTLPDGTKIKDYVAEEKKAKLLELVKTVVIINFFKRLESSMEAFRKTIGNLENYIRAARDYAAQHGYFVPPRMKGDITNSEGDDGEWVFPVPEEVFSGKYSSIAQKCRLSQDEVKKFREGCDRDLETIGQIKGLIQVKDAKLSGLINRLKQIDLSGNNGVIIFTEFADTATYLYRETSRVFKRVMLTTGSISIGPNGRETRNRKDVIKEFMKNGGYLITTDVLSESQNLQNAQYLVNYDFPWNPVVLIQRAGRIDRIGSPHRAIYIINMLPANGDRDDPRSLAYFLKVMEKLHYKIGEIKRTVGLDASVLGEEISPKNFADVEKIAAGDRRVLEELRERMEQFTRDPMDQLAKIIKERGEDWLKKIPYGIGAYKRHSRNGIFILFRNGDDFYWRLKFFDGENETVENPNEIIDTLLSGEHDTKGETIDYSKLMKWFVGMKREVAEEIRRSHRQKLTVGTVRKLTKRESEVLDALRRAGDEGIELSGRFNRMRSKKSVVDTLYNALREGNLLEKAREILVDGSEEGEREEEPDVDLKRVCWCWLEKR